MKRLVIIALSCSCLCSCASWRFLFATPRADPSVYYEYSLNDVFSGNITGEEAYEEKSVSYGYGYSERIFKYFHIVSNVYIRYDEGKIILFDDKGNSKRATFSRNDVYNIKINGDYDPDKAYRVKYTLCWGAASYPSTRDNDLSIEIDAIEGLLTYSEYVQLEVETAYQTALNSPGIDVIAEYIRTYGYRDYFNNDAYAEIARRLENDRNIKFDNLRMTGNPYAYEKDAIYFLRYYSYRYYLYYPRYFSRDDSIRVRQRMENGGILCYIGNYALVIEKTPDARSIGEFIQNAYLRYVGTRTMMFTDGSVKIIPVFDLIYTLD